MVPSGRICWSGLWCRIHTSSLLSLSLSLSIRSVIPSVLHVLLFCFFFSIIWLPFDYYNLTLQSTRFEARTRFSSAIFPRSLCVRVCVCGCSGFAFGAGGRKKGANLASVSVRASEPNLASRKDAFRRRRIGKRNWGGSRTKGSLLFPTTMRGDRQPGQHTPHGLFYRCCCCYCYGGVFRISLTGRVIRATHSGRSLSVLLPLYPHPQVRSTRTA